MATKTYAPFADVGRRLEIALRASKDPYAAVKVGKRLNLSPTAWAKAIVGSTGMSVKRLLIAAEMLDVDPRWLVVGKRSRAAVAAWKRLGDVEDRFRETRIGDDDRTALFDAIRTLPEPAAAPFVCRYCGCTPEAGCDVGCEWVDVNATICSACVDPSNVPADAED